jgi:hypothetical protein
MTNRWQTHDMTNRWQTHDMTNTCTGEG